MRLLRFTIVIALLGASCAAGSATPTSSGVPTTDRDSEGNLLAGPGWELLSFTRSGLTYGVAVAENEVDTERMWASIPFEVPVPTVDYATHVLMVLGHAVSGSCPEIQFQGLVIEPDRVFGEFTFIHGHQGCTDDANPAAYLLAVEREALPQQFLLSLTEEDICRGCAEDAITVDLTSDAADDSQWWAQGRFGVVLAGAPPVDSHVFTMSFAGRVEPLAVLAADWRAAPTWYTGGENFPNRVEAFTAECIGGEECIEDLDSLQSTGPRCGVNIEPEPRQDLAIIITFAADGSCEIDLVPGSDGTEFR